MLSHHIKSISIGLALFLAVFGLDQYLKFKAVLSAKGVRNLGSILGLIPNNNLGIILGIVFLAVIVYAIFRLKIAIYPLYLLAGALVSNLVDRFIYKGVIDYWIFFGLFVFNLADFLIVAIIVLWLLVYYSTKKDSA